MMGKPSRQSMKALKEARDGWRKKNWRINAYICPEGHITSTVDVDEGVTPAMIGCTHKGCDESSGSSFYPTDRPIPAFIPKPAWEWYRPEPLEAVQLDKWDYDHVEKGGLLLRRRTSAQPVMRAE